MKKFLKKMGLWIGLALLAIILLSFLFPTTMKVSRSIEVNAPADRVFDQVNDLRNWEKWSPWKRMDPTMVMTFSNPPVGQNAFYKWESQDKHMGKGTMTLVKVTPYEEIVTSLEMEDWPRSQLDIQILSQRGCNTSDLVNGATNWFHALEPLHGPHDERRAEKTI
jgi:uncharacterized protein YndB with AHSA1/START domain